jgi:hypothetical protein
VSFKVKKLTVGKGKTVAHEEDGKWLKQYFELEAEVEEESALELAKGSLEALLDTWLKGESITEEKPSWNPNNIKWEKAQGSKGEFERSEDVNSLDFKAMLKDINAHGGHLTREGYYYWVYKNGATVGRKQKAPKTDMQTQTKQPLQIEQYFPSDLHDLLDFAEKGDLIVIKPKQFLGSENFARISAMVRDLGGSYVSEGKDSRFEIQKKAV